MAVITYSQVLQAVANTLDTIPEVKKSYALADIPEGAPSVPMIATYIQEYETDSKQKGAQTSFGGVVKQKRMLVHCDALARQTGHIGQDFKAVTEVASAIQDKLEGLTTPYFGVTGLRTMHWRAFYVTLHYAGADYAGLRHEITFTIF